MCSLPGFYAPKADLTAPKSDFRFTPESGLMSDISPCPFRAISGSRTHSINSSRQGDHLAAMVIRATRLAAILLRIARGLRHAEGPARL